MPFQWQDFLQLAQELAVRDDGPLQEAKLRSSGSRSYFAAFGHASRYAERGGLLLTGAVGDHGAVRAHFKRKGNLRVVKGLEDLRVWRSQCDYDDAVQNLEALVANAIKSADEVIRLLRLRPDPGSQPGTGAASASG
jgi:hypothetical protein